MSQLGASSFKDGCARWAVPVDPGSCQTERRTLADISGPNLFFDERTDLALTQIGRFVD